MEGQQSVGPGGIMVPNVYDVYLSPPDFAHYEAARRSLSRNLESHVGRTARQRRFQLVSHVTVDLKEDQSLSAGDMRVESFMRDVEAPAEPIQHTSVLPQVEPEEAPVTRPSSPLLVLNGDTYAVLRSPTRVGRLADNDIVLDDKRVSRHHAELTGNGARWVLRDVGSTNGTAVNGKIVKEAVLKSGDTISLGGLEVTWEQ
jgi:hypothetical protein